MLEKFWGYNQQSNNYQPSEKEPLSTFPTIVNIKKREVYCRTHHCWEQILSFETRPPRHMPKKDFCNFFIQKIIFAEII